MAKCSVCGKEIRMRYEMNGQIFCHDCYVEASKQWEASMNQIKQDKEIPVIATVFAVFAWITWTLGGVSAIILGFALNSITYGVICLAVMFISGCIPMGFSTIIRLLAEIAWNTKPRK